MNKRELYDSFENISTQLKETQALMETLQQEMGSVLEKNAELEIENQHLRERLRELAEKNKPKQANEAGGLSKSRQNLEKLYEEGFHVCNVMYGSRRVNDEPCVFCQDVIYGERPQ